MALEANIHKNTNKLIKDYPLFEISLTKQIMWSHMRMRFPEGPIIFTSSVSILKEISWILGNPDSVQVNDRPISLWLVEGSTASTPKVYTIIWRKGIYVNYVVQIENFFGI